MATLQKIRSAGPLLIIVVGFALLAFIAGDAWKIIRPNQGLVMAGKIDGKSIAAYDYQQEVEKYADIIKFSNGLSNLTDQQYDAVKDEVWNNMVRKSILQKEADALGLKVTNAEVMAVIEEGTDPLLMQTPFSDPETGEFDADYLNEFLVSYSQMDRSMFPQDYAAYYDNIYAFWLFIEDNIKTSLLYQKYMGLIQGSVITNPVSQKSSYENRIKRSDILLAAAPFTWVADSLVKVTSADVKKAFKERKEMFNQPVESRDIYYIDVMLEPSDADRQALLAEVTDYAVQLEGVTEDMASFIRQTESDFRYYELPSTPASLPQDVADRLDSVQVGQVYGPYYNGIDDTYNAFKLVDVKDAYDSLFYRRIQVPATEPAELTRLSDSIYNALRGGADFMTLANTYSQTGDVEVLASDMFEGRTLSANDLKYLQTLTSMKKGELVKMDLDGVSIIVKMENVKNPVKKYDVAVIKRQAFFSNETSNIEYDKLSRFISENTSLESLRNNAEAAGYNAYKINGFYSDEHNVANVSKSHEALRWLFDAKEGEVSKIYEVGADNDHLLVVALDKINEKGYASVESVQSSLIQVVTDQKKAEILQSKLAGAGSFADLKSVPGVQIDTVKFVSFAAPAYISMTYANEQNVSAVASSLEKGQTSAPFKGYAGVYVAQKLSEEYSAEFDASVETERIKALFGNIASSQVLNELYMKANVEDNRYKTF